MAEKSTSWVKWLLIGCGGCLLLGILIVVVSVFFVKNMFQGGAFYQEPPKVETSAEVSNPDAIHVFLDVKTAADVGLTHQTITITEGEMNAFLKNALETTKGAKAPGGPPLTLLMDFKNNELDLYMSVEGEKASPGMSWMKLGYLFEYDISKDTQPLSLDLREVKMGKNVLPINQWQSQSETSMRGFRDMAGNNPALIRIFEMMQNDLVLSNDVSNLVITESSLTYTLK